MAGDTRVGGRRVSRLAAQRTRAAQGRQGRHRGVLRGPGPPPSLTASPRDASHAIDRRAPWCPGPESNRHSLAANGFSAPRRLSPPRIARSRPGVRHGRDGRMPTALGPRRPLSTPAGANCGAPDWLGVAAGFRPRGFADFDGIQRGVSVPAAQFQSKSVASTNFATGAPR